MPVVCRVSRAEPPRRMLPLTALLCWLAEPLLRTVPSTFFFVCTRWCCFLVHAWCLKRGVQPFFCESSLPADMRAVIMRAVISLTAQVCAESDRSAAVSGSGGPGGGVWGRKQGEQCSLASPTVPPLGQQCCSAPQNNTATIQHCPACTPTT